MDVTLRPSLNVRTLRNIGLVKEVILEPKEPIVVEFMKQKTHVAGFSNFLLDITSVINTKPCCVIFPSKNKRKPYKKNIVEGSPIRF